jgi:drug/metabolite transporter (DMT)-like permease
LGIVLGLTAALGWGVADFMARFSARRIGTYRTLLYMQLIGLLTLTALLSAIHGWGPITNGVTRHGLGWVILAGLLNTVSSLMLYRSFEIGVLAIVAPVAASYPALTVILSLLSGETLHRARGIGLVAALAGVVLAATSFAPTPQEKPAEHHHKGHLTRGVLWAILAAIGYGILFWVLGFRVMPAFGGAVSVWFIRLTTFSALALMVKPMKITATPPSGSAWWLVGGIGIVDTAAFISNNMALKTEQVAVASVLSSLYGAVTVLLAAVFLREKLEWSQWVGIVLIFTGIAILSR